MTLKNKLAERLKRLEDKMVALRDYDAKAGVNAVATAELVTNLAHAQCEYFADVIETLLTHFSSENGIDLAKDTSEDSDK